ncbi:Fe-Mn family superoxide dismutase [Haladaptatus sp. NG-WS-4]
MTPCAGRVCRGTGAETESKLAAAIDEHFGSCEGFKQDFSVAAKNVEGSGWRMLVYDHIADEPMVVQAESEIFDDGFSKRECTSLPVINEQSKYNLSRGLKKVGVVHSDSMPVETALAVDTSVSAKRFWSRKPRPHRAKRVGRDSSLCDAPVRHYF